MYGEYTISICLDQSGEYTICLLNVRNELCQVAAISQFIILLVKWHSTPDPVRELKLPQIFLKF